MARAELSDQLFGIPEDAIVVILNELKLSDVISFKISNRAAVNTADKVIFMKIAQIIKLGGDLQEDETLLERTYFNAHNFEYFENPWNSKTQRQIISTFEKVAHHGERPTQFMLDQAQRAQHYEIVCWLRSVGVRFDRAAEKDFFAHHVLNITPEFLTQYARAAPDVPFWTKEMNHMYLVYNLDDFVYGPPERALPVYMSTNHPKFVVDEKFKWKHLLRFIDYPEDIWHEVYNHYAWEIEFFDKEVGGIVAKLGDRNIILDFLRAHVDPLYNSEAYLATYLDPEAKPSFPRLIEFISRKINK